jgi:hypothetical protein
MVTATKVKGRYSVADCPDLKFFLELDSKLEIYKKKPLMNGFFTSFDAAANIYFNNERDGRNE